MRGLSLTPLVGILKNAALAAFRRSQLTTSSRVKLRIKDNSVRLRLDQDDVRRFEEDGRVEGVTPFDRDRPIPLDRRGPRHR